MDAIPPIPKDPTLPTWQQWTYDMLVARGFQKEQVSEIFMLFTEECGELAKAIRKLTLHTDPNSSHHDVADELADVMLYVMDLANVLGVDLEQALRDKEEKNKLRTWTKSS